MQQRSMRTTGLLFLFVLVLFATSGVAPQFAASAAAEPKTPPSAAPPADNPADNYVLGPNDRVRLKVYGEPYIAG
jgi:polysaccharide export outer membrane protein